MARVNSKNMELTLPGRVKERDLDVLRGICNDLVVVKKNDTHLFCTRKAGKKFQFRSVKALGKLLPNINSADIQVVRTAYSDRQPDTFFRNHIDPYTPIEEQVLFAQGRFEDFSQILANIKSDVKKKRNLAVASSITAKGVIGTYHEGGISAGEVKSNLAVQAIIEEKRVAEKNKTKDMEYGAQWGFVCHRTGKDHTITSYKGDERGETQGEQLETQIDTNAAGKTRTKIVGIKKPPVKQKHYFFYSPTGYGKTHMLSTVFSQMCNVTSVNDPGNFVGARSDAQFIVIDEYAPEKRLSMADLKSLTSGNPKYSFAGNRKSHGASFIPRNDVQVVILSNHHLFYCMGKGRDRKISSVDAWALRDRFHIVKMDEGLPGVSDEIDEASTFISDKTSTDVYRRVNRYEDEIDNEDMFCA